jgi:uncharacterized protein YecT (DUF1311 family)
MQLFRSSSPKSRLSLLAFAVLLVMAAATLPSNAAGQQPAQAGDSGSPPSSAQPQPPVPQSQASQAPVSTYDKAIFHNPIPGDQLAFLNHFSGSTSNHLVRDKQYRKLMQNVIPNWTFHYGWDMSITEALDQVLKGSSLPVQLREGRYFMVSGHNGPYLKGRGFIWIDMQEGIALGGFYFHPTNGEPTPTVTVFSSQVKEESLRMSQLPPQFALDLNRWSAASGVPPVTTRYFIGGVNKKILLEHDEDYCAPADAKAAPADCEQRNADAADMDLNAAYYLEQTGYATNATAWMIVGPDQVAWIQVRDNTCGIGPGQLRCRIRITRERTHVIINRHGPHVAQLPHK